MRKLSKKISMLMVLAMLVSLFSGIVSASAASKWSFYDRTADVVVERNETYVMEKDQYANFDLYCEGEEADADIYSYYWESSDPDVVFVDKTNGRLRADKYGKAEAGDKAMISVYIDNKTTEKNENAKRSFYIEIAADEVEEVEYKVVTMIGDAVLGAETLAADKDYELTSTVTADGEAVEAVVTYTIDGVAVEKLNLKDGEYTVVVTATIDEVVVDTEEYAIVVKAEVPEIVEAKQVALNAVEIKLSTADWAKEFASKVSLSYFAGDVEIADIVKSAVAKDETVTITLYNNLTPDTTYKFSYDEYDCSATIKGVKTGRTDVTRIEVVGGRVPQIAKADVKIFAGDVEITSDALKEYVTYKTLDENVCDVTETTGDIFFFEIGKSAPIEAKYDMGWNEAGEELTDITNKGVYTSVEEYTYTNPNSYAVSAVGKDVDGAKKLAYSNSLVVALDDDYAVYAKYVENKYDGKTNDKFICGGTNEEGKTFTFHSTNDSIVMVNLTTGELSPCKTGSASIYLQDANGKTVGSVAVTVKDARKLQTFTARIDDKMLSTGIESDKTYASVSTKDQYTADYAANYSIKLISPLSYNNAEGNPVALNATDFFSNANALAANNGKVELQLNKDGALAAIKDKSIQTVVFELIATDYRDPNNAKPVRLNVSIKDMTGAVVANSALKVSATNVDTKLDKANKDAYNVTINLAKVDKDLYEMGNEAITLAKTPSAVTDAYTIVISKGNDKYDTTNGHFTFDDVKKEIIVKPVLDDGTNITKLAPGTYKIQLYKGINGTNYRPVDTKSLTITDSTAPITVEVKTDTITAKSASAVEAALKFVRNGKEIANGNPDNITVVEVVKPVADIEGKYYVRTIKVKVSPKEMKGDSGFTGTFEETVTVNQLFKVQ